MKSKKIFALFSFIFIAYSASSQNSKSYFQIANEYFNKGDYKSAVINYEMSLSNDKTTYGLNHIYIGNDYFLIGECYSKIGKYDNAISNLKKALEIFESSKIQSAKTASETKADAAKFASDTALELGNIYEALGEYKNALSYFKKELSINLKVYGESHIKTSNAYRDVGYMDYQCGNYQESINEFTKALEIRNLTLGENSLEFAESLIDLAEVFTATENYTTAFEKLKRAEEIYTSLLQSDNINFAYLYQSFADYYRRTANINQSLTYGFKAIEIFDKNYGENNSASIAVYLAEIEKCYALMGDDSRSLSILLKCKKYYETHPHQNLTNVLSSISDIYSNKGDYSNAIFYCQEAIKTSKKYWGEKTIGMAGLYHSLGLIYGLKKDYETALTFYAKSLDLYIELEQEDTEEILSLVGSIATAFFCLDDYEKAEYYQNEVCRRANILGYTGTEATSYYDLGILYKNPDFQNIKKSAECFKKSFELRKNSVFYKSTIDSAMRTFYITAGLDSFSNEKDFFHEMFSLVADTSEHARLDMASLKSDLLKETLPILYYAIDFEAKNNNLENAFEYSEMLRSRGFLDQIGLERALSLDGVTESERKQIKELTKQISIARKEIETQSSLSANKRDSEKMSQAEKNLSVAEKALSKLDEKIAKRLPTYAQLRNPKTVKAKDAQKWCGKNRVILEYVLWNPTILDDCEILKESNTRKCAEDIKFSSYCLIITNKKITAVPLDSSYDYNSAINYLRDAITHWPIKSEVTFENQRNELYEKLVQPVLPYIKGVKDVLIVPDGNLAFLPFDMLRENADSADFGKKYAIGISPSVSVSMIADKVKSKSSDALLFGGAWYDKSLSEEEHNQTLRGNGKRGYDRSFATVDNQTRLSVEDLQNILKNEGSAKYFDQKKLNWHDLPGTVVELEALQKATFKKATVETQKSASEATLKSMSKNGLLSNYSILHFACHGYFDNDLSEMSSVLFSEVSGKISESQDDGYLTIGEACSLNLNAQMVCLSACQTGLGEIKKGEGMVGLSRAFMVAGSKNVGVTLWCVDDEATAEFMTRMYKKVKSGMSYSEAYRKVKNEFRNSDEYKHPYYWAAFVVYE
ncbi:MAG: CHAT domain-containing protein [Treponema sp.]|nr:CHAT domain-containing protein [Treponema sp.]MBR5645021.1 CHAT domain-containing protein [Treponema sp.]